MVLLKQWLIIPTSVKWGWQEQQPAHVALEESPSI